jgi:hypothetical protein
MVNTDFDSLLKQTEFVVEADGFASLELWAKYSAEAKQHSKIGEWVCYNNVKWEQLNPGCVKTVGYYHKQPVNICLTWQRLNGHLIVFWEAISRIVDYELIDKWFEKNCCPKYDNGYRNANTNAMNFHHVYHYVRGE